MKTSLLTTNTHAELTTALNQATSLLEKGEIVAFPTETVYGLGANAFDATAVAKIFTAKNRPADNPLIVHISNRKQLAQVVSEISQSAELLIDTFWPGPLSLVLPKHKNVPDITTAGLQTVVVRQPKHPITQALISTLAKPIAAPSANLSGKISPTTAGHVLADMDGKIPLIIDGGPCAFGLESTVIDCTVEPFTILRPGAITFEQLRCIIPTIRPHNHLTTQKSPGMKYRHYSPTASVILFVGDPEETGLAMREYFRKQTPNTALTLWYQADFSTKEGLQLPTSPSDAAPRLFEAMRSLDERHPAVILIQGYDETGLGAAIMNRLRKAASKIIPI